MKRTREFLALLLSLLLLLTAGALPALADDSQEELQPILTAPIDLTGATQDQSGTGWDWDQAAKTLAIHNESTLDFQGAECAIKLPDGARVETWGNAAIQNFNTVGIYFAGSGAVADDGGSTFTLIGGGGEAGYCAGILAEGTLSYDASRLDMDLQTPTGTPEGQQPLLSGAYGVWAGGALMLKADGYSCNIRIWDAPGTSYAGEAVGLCAGADLTLTNSMVYFDIQRAAPAVGLNAKSGQFIVLEDKTIVVSPLADGGLLSTIDVVQVGADCQVRQVRCSTDGLFVEKTNGIPDLDKPIASTDEFFATEGWKWDRDTRTLTLSDARMEHIYLPNNATLRLLGETTMTAKTGMVVKAGENLTVIGPGSLDAMSSGGMSSAIVAEGLTIESGTVKAASSYQCATLGSFAMTGGRLELNGAGAGMTCDGEGNAFYMNGGTLEITAPSETLTLSGLDSVLIEGGSVVVNNPLSSDVAVAASIWSCGHFTVTGGSLTVNGGNEGTLYVTSTDFNLRGGDVNLDGWEGLCLRNYGAEKTPAFTMTGGTLTVKAGSNGIDAQNVSVSLEGGTVTALSERIGLTLLTELGSPAAALSITGGKQTFTGDWAAVLTSVQAPPEDLDTLEVGQPQLKNMYPSAGELAYRDFLVEPEENEEEAAPCTQRVYAYVDGSSTDPERPFDFVLDQYGSVDGITGAVKTLTYADKATEPEKPEEPQPPKRPSGGGSPAGGFVMGGGASVPPSVTPVETGFGDVPPESWYAAGVKTVTDLGLFQGVAEGQFAPGQTMSRAMLATVLHRLAGAPAGGEHSFADVAADTWYTDAVAWSAASGVLTSTGGGFSPDGQVTREQLAVMLYRFASYANMSPAGNTDLTHFNDHTAISDWARSGMTWAVSASILKGTDGGALNPGATITRAEAAVMLQRFAALMGNG